MIHFSLSQVYSFNVHGHSISSDPSPQSKTPSHRLDGSMHSQDDEQVNSALLHVQLHPISSDPSPQSSCLSHFNVIGRHSPPPVAPHRKLRTRVHSVSPQSFSSELSPTPQSILPSHLKVLGMHFPLSQVNSCSAQVYVQFNSSSPLIQSLIPSQRTLLSTQ